MPNSAATRISETGSASTGGPRRVSARRGRLVLADRYLVSEIFWASFRGLVWFAGLFLAFAVVSGAKKIVQDEMPLYTAISYIVLQMPRIILFTIPASLLYGTVGTFSEMSSKGEITALYAGGMGLARMLRAPLIMAGLLAVFAFFLQEIVVPGAEYKKSQIMIDGLQRMGKTSGFKMVDPQGNGPIERIVQADSFDPKARLFTNLSVQLFRPDRTMRLQVSAATAVWDQETGAWLFTQGHGSGFSDSVKNDTSPYQSNQTFESMVIKTDILPQPKAFKDAIRGIDQQLAQKNYEMVTWRDVIRYRRRLASEAQMEKGELRKKTQHDVNGATYGLHDKFATPLLCLALVLVGAPLGVRPQRTASAGVAMGMSLVVLIVYYVVWTIATQWGKSGVGHPMLAAYLPLLVIGISGLVLIARKS